MSTATIDPKTYVAEKRDVIFAELDDSGERVEIYFNYSPDRVTKIKQVPSARFRPRDKGGPKWWLNRDIQTMRRLREAFGDSLELGQQLIDWAQSEVDKERNLTELSIADDAELENVPKAFINHKEFKLRPYQKADIKFMSTTDVINANQPGAGKTIETIAAVFESGMEWGCHLVFAPVAALRSVWETEIRGAYARAGFDEPTILTGDSPRERGEAVSEAKELFDNGYSFWLVINPYNARLKPVKKGKGKDGTTKFEDELVQPELAEIEWDSIVIDEFHLMGLSNPTTQGARGVNQIAELTQPTRKYALSGTPMGGKPIKLWGALHFLNPDEFTSRWNWARHWLVINNNGYGNSIEGIMPGREVDFYNHLRPYLVRRTKRRRCRGCRRSSGSTSGAT
jgi:SNF2 family DNA or RNA helicase